MHTRIEVAKHENSASVARGDIPVRLQFLKCLATSQVRRYLDVSTPSMKQLFCNIDIKLSNFSFSESSEIWHQFIAFIASSACVHKIMKHMHALMN